MSLAVGAGGALVIAAALVVGLRLKLNADAESKILAALNDHYSGHTLIVADRREAPGRRSDYQFGYQVCFEVVLDGKERRSARITGDPDGGSFAFGKEYRSMRDCETAFSQG